MNRIVNLLQLAYRAGKVKFGYERLEKEKEDCFIIAATDLSNRTKRHILSLNRFKVYFYFDKSRLSCIFNKNNVGVVIVKRDGIGTEIEKSLQQILKEAFIEEHHSKTTC